MSLSLGNLRTSTAGWVVAILTMAAVLVTVAVFQYRWSVQTAEVAEARIATDLQSFMMDWGLDLFEDFSAICISLQIEPDSGASENWQVYLTRLHDWRRSSDESELVQDVFIWETSRARDPVLFRLDSANRRLREETVAENLRPLLSRLDANSSSLDVALLAWELPGDRSAGAADSHSPKHPTIGWQFDPYIPALVHPIYHRPLPADTTPSANSARVDWIVVVIDRRALQKKLLPELTRQHFGGIGRDKYAVVVSAAGWPQGILYSSREQGVDDADAEMNIFGPPPPAIGERPLQSAINVASIRSQGNQRLSAPTWFPVIQYSAGEKPWTLIVDDLSESLDSSFARIRNKNLLISGLVLAVLAVAMALTLRATRRAQKLAAQQVEFVAAVSHELGTSLAVISSAAENIADGVVQSPPSLRQYGSLIRNQGRQLAELVDDILAFAAIRNGKNRYHVTSVSVPDLIAGVVDRTSDQAREAGVTVAKSLEPDLPPIAGDRQALSHCLQNLVVNAVKYGAQGRWVGIRAFVNKLPDSHGREVCISVADRGLGVASSEIEHIFQPFYRSPAVTAAQIRGTGLGLAIARSIAESMGGTISVTSTIGQGSVFTLHLLAASETSVADLESIASPSVRQS